MKFHETTAPITSSLLIDGLMPALSDSRYIRVLVAKMLNAKSIA